MEGIRDGAFEVCILYLEATHSKEIAERPVQHNSIFPTTVKIAEMSHEETQDFNRNATVKGHHPIINIFQQLKKKIKNTKNETK